MKGFYSFLTDLYFKMSYVRQIVWTFLILTIFSILFLILSREGNISTKTVGWEKSMYISPANIISKNINVASKGRFIAAVFEGELEKSRGIFMSVSFDEGGKFLQPVQIAVVNEKIDLNPQVAISGEGVITVAWHQIVQGTLKNRIFLSISKDMGANWIAPQQVEIGYELEMSPRIFYDHRGGLHLFFQAFKDRHFNLYHAVSDNNVKFDITGPIIKLTENIKGAFFPAITLSLDHVYIVWQGKTADFTDDLFFIKSSNYGRSWSKPKKITESKANDASPSILLHDGTLYVAYRNSDEKNWAIKMLKGNLYGENWDPVPIHISKTNVDCFSPKVADFNNEIFVVWYDSREENSSIYLRKFAIAESILSEEVKLSPDKASAKNPVFITLDKDKSVVLFWEELSRIVAKFNDVYASPPSVFSATHPDGVWSRSPVAVIEWTPPEDESGIVGYASIIGKSDARDINPTIMNIKPGQTRRVISDLTDGVTYFHIRSVDGAGNLSRTIHYKIQVSSNPLPSPVIVSSTHPQGKAMSLSSVLFNWAITDTERLKGFVWSLSKDAIKNPENFISRFDIKVDDLEEGRYFFSLSAVDKTDMKSSVAVYPFIVGSTGIIDPEDLKKMGQKDLKVIEKTDKVTIVEVKHPGIEIICQSEIFDNDPFHAVITLQNLHENDVIGYSIDFSPSRRELPDKINLKSKIINIEIQKNGKYFISAKAKYRKYVNGTIELAWTKPFTREISVSIPLKLSPLEIYLKVLLEQIREKVFIVSSVLMLIIITIMTTGYGEKLLYVYKVAIFRMHVFFSLWSKTDME